ncbi:hypothetical protein [Rhabdochlamydiaceae symbiont of Dictyostelium giganteum]|uniref:hypothetical protein n=1 Tax=Rhabdochlamydiaceae symbiont of Dictyostelium giganteum TaxID=3342349 RepID=UPI00384B4942
MESKLLICPYTFEAWVKMIPNSYGKARVEILAPELIERFTKRGMRVPLHLRTIEMRENDKTHLHLTDLEKNPDYFTQIFQETVYKNELLKERFFWKNTNDYVDAASEKKQVEESWARGIAALKKRCEEAESRGTTLAEEIIDEVEKEYAAKEAIAILNPSVKHHIQEIEKPKAHVNKTASKSQVPSKIGVVARQCIGLKKKHHDFIVPYKMNNSLETP